jgi:hypothetical protein
MGKLSHFHAGLLDAIADHATSLVQVRLFRPLAANSQHLGYSFMQLVKNPVLCKAAVHHVFHACNGR